MENDRLTTVNRWDCEWAGRSLPLIYERSLHYTCINAILDVLDRWLPRTPGLSVLEIGGAVGGYLSYMHKHFGYAVCALDYSTLGCRMTRENFRLQGINGTVVQGDLFSDLPLGRTFDIVCSFGFVEHFKNLESVIRRHTDFLKPGGLLVVEVPSFLGVNGWIARWLAPQTISEHELSTMNLAHWRAFEKDLRLERIFMGYIGGFKPTCYGLCERSGLFSRGANKGLSLFERFISRWLPPLRRMNGRWVSCCAMGVWRSPSVDESGPAPRVPPQQENR